MALKDFIARFKTQSSDSHISWKIDPLDGVAFVFSDVAMRGLESLSLRDPLFGMQYTYLKGLEEQGMAERFKNGFLVYSRFITEQDDQFSQLFELPAKYTGSYRARIEGNTGQSKFNVTIELHMPNGDNVSSYQLQGPFLKLGEKEWYQLPTADWLGMEAVMRHQQLSPEQRTEYENNWLVFELQTAAGAGMDIDLAQFRNIELVRPESIGVSMDLLSNGDLRLSPSFGGGLNHDDVRARLGQFSGRDQHAILRVKNKFVLLDEARVKAAEEILTQQVIPKDQVKQFLKTPTAYLDAALIDLDTGFSLRVEGAERYEHHYFGEVEQSPSDWFATAADAVEPINRIARSLDSMEKVTEFEEELDNARKAGADCVQFDDGKFDISEPEKVDSTLETLKTRIQQRELTGDLSDEPEEEVKHLEQAVVSIKKNDEETDFTSINAPSTLDLSAQTFERENLKRSPFPHQEEGIQWLLSHLELTKDSGATGGALLADDMGLGKTYMTLVGIAEWMRRLKSAGTNSEKPYLIVAPLSLIENWVAEVNDTFIQSPFSEIVVLQSGADLKKYRIKGASRETQQSLNDDEQTHSSDNIRYALKVGSHFGMDRLDMPRRLVLTTYQTLRDYQFSLSRIDWAVAAFDEAQNLKNPNAMATIAAKALKADFKLLATGTPVENSLKDFWCLMDAAVPGLLDSWQEFRAQYIAPITAVSDPEEAKGVKGQMGKNLRERVGAVMLRRTKAEKLQGLPQKVIYSGDKHSQEGKFLPDLAATMKGRQLAYYDEIIERVHSTPASDKRAVVLSSLHLMKLASIDRGLAEKEHVPHSAKELLQKAGESAKIISMIKTLEAIKERQEKVLIFAISKAVQAYVAALVQIKFGIPVDIINGETAAVSQRDPSQTRKGIIDTFQQKPGFGVIVMSPVAAGVGLTVVGANNVIHLERHWNPAKEAQATDRVYRIGQERSVNVYLPIALHPQKLSFDQHLAALLAGKIDLSDSVVSQETVDQEEMMSCF